jgi:lipid A ethanolaminephosphotransferase
MKAADIFSFRWIPALSQVQAIILVALFMAVFHNLTFFEKFYAYYADVDSVAIYTLLVGLFHASILSLLLSILGVNRIFGLLGFVLLLSSASAAYFIDTYKVIIDSHMIDNVLETNTSEAMDLIHLRLFVYLLVFAVLPGVLLWKSSGRREAFLKTLFKRVGLAVGSIVVMLSTVFVASDFFSSFLREQEALKDYANPSAAIDSIIKVVERKSKKAMAAEPFVMVASDAVKAPAGDKPKLFVLVVGETARGDHFSLNGYERNTNPRLAEREVVSFKKFYSCGTTTAYSLPCMFSYQTHANYDRGKADNMQNILDILQQTGVSVLWRDNNSGSKGVSDRVLNEDYSKPSLNPVCDDECRDVGMLDKLENWVAEQSGKDVLVVLHQLGSHGPAYYKRYPKSFEQFKPVCESNQLDECERQSIVNTYDNTILYTDYFLSEVIDWLKPYSDSHKVAMWYISDHGESLGEGGLYLHGLPYSIAPEAQKLVPAIYWDANSADSEQRQSLLKQVNEKRSHDVIFHSLLGAFDVNTAVYDEKLDIFSGMKN